jgi:hypothetical protein
LARVAAQAPGASPGPLTETYADGDGATLVEALDAQLMVEAGLKPVADEAAARLHAALDRLSI